MESFKVIAYICHNFRFPKHVFTMRLKIVSLWEKLCNDVNEVKSNKL